MNNKDNKAALKKAREFFDKKNYKDAIKTCKRILKYDGDNYNALVLVAAAFQEVEDLKDQVPACLAKATKLQPTNPLAWKGLICYYEKDIENPNIWPELISIYCQLLQFDSNSTKYEHYLNTCAELLLNLKNDNVFDQTMTVFRSLHETYSHESQENSDNLKLLNNTLVSLLTKYPNNVTAYDDLLEKSLSCIINNEKITNKLDHFKRYLKLLYKLQKYELQLDQASEMHKLYPDNSYPLEWICRTYSEQVILHNKCKEFCITDYHEKLLKLNKNSIFALLAKATDMYVQKSYISCRDILNYLVSIKNLLPAWILLIDVNMKLYCFNLAESAALEAEKAISSMEDKSQEERVRLSLIESMLKQNERSKWETVLKKYSNFLNKKTPKHLLLLNRTYILLENVEVTGMLSNLEDYPDLRKDVTLLKAMHLINKNQLEEAKNVLENALDTSEAWVLMGKIYSKMADYSHSHMSFLKGVHLDPNNWECLVYLGNYYKDHGNDLERSKKCYQKALQINPDSHEAGFNLSIVYRLLKEDEANLQLLHEMTSNGKGPKWAWLQMGLLKLETGDPQEAIQNLRNVIRYQPNDGNSWETLADAYFARGAFVSAMKSYQKALELRPESFYSMMQVAHIKLLLSRYEEAKEEYEKVIKKNEDNVVALKGLAETHMGLARYQTASQRWERAGHNLQIAVDYLLSIVTKRSDFSCIWKLLGNACYLIVKLPEKYCNLRVPTSLIKFNDQSENTKSESRKMEKQEILTLSVWSYCRALNLTKDSSLIWHDLATSYLTQLQECPSINKAEIIAKSLSAIKHAIKLSPSSWYHWNLLGVICMNDNIRNYALAQHSFMTAIELEHNNSVSWTNLGSLYLKLDEYHKANEAFSWAQRNDPAYVNSWIGQAMIAEQCGSPEAMDLFRHSTQISYHPQGALGYAHWVIQTLLDPEAKQNPSYTYSIVNMYAVTVATDCIHWYIASNPKDVYALNMYGLLLERQNMYRSAAEYFYQALIYVLNEEEKDFVSINLARVCVQLGDNEKAIKLCQEIKKPSFKSYCQLAIALFKEERYEESYSTYETILEWLADTDSQKGNILCAMAAMAYMFESTDAVKTLLFQCIEFKPRIIPGLLAAAAMGILHDDHNLSNLILKELESFEDEPEHRHNIALLSACWSMKEDGIQAAIRCLSKTIHKHPGDARLWAHFVTFLTEAKSKFTLTCALKALFLGKDTNDIHVSKMASIASYNELKNHSSTGFRSVLKMVHSFPGCVDNWATLIAALLSGKNFNDSQPTPLWTSLLTSIVRKELPCSQEMNQWLLKNEQYAIQMSGESCVQ